MAYSYGIYSYGPVDDALGVERDAPVEVQPVAYIVMAGIPMAACS